MATIKDVAREAKVSIATVSRVINQDDKVRDKTREHVLSVMKSLGYQVNVNARALSTQKTATLGLVVPDISDPFFACLAKGVDSIARQHQSQVLLCTAQNSSDSEQQAIDSLLQRRCDGIILYCTHLADSALIDIVERYSNVVVVARNIPKIAENCIYLDDELGGQLAAEHLLALGHSRFASIMSELPIQDPKLRLSGFKTALDKQALTLTEEQVVYGTPDQLGGELTVNSLLKNQQTFTALFAYNDAMAIGAISALEEAGFKVPDDISVIGFDDIYLAHYSRPKLTTLHYPVEAIAKHAALLAINKHTQLDKTAHSHRYQPTLVERQSTAFTPTTAPKQSLNKNQVERQN